MKGKTGLNIRFAAATALFLALIPAQSYSAGPMTNFGSVFRATQDGVDGHAAAPVILAQAGDMSFRVGQLEEQIRALNGRIEELSFQLLEMQEQMRRMQEDNEYRFQELEGGGRRGDAAPVRQDDTDVAAMDSATEQFDQSDQERVEGTLGELTLDQNTLQSGELEAPANTDQTQTAALPEAGREQLWNAAYGNILSGDYALAEQDFERFIQEYPDSPKISDAYFWLGESQYAQGQYNVAARTLLTAHKQFPQSAKAPEMLLKLGMSLAALDNRDTACATYREVLLRYPKASDALKKKVAIEQGAMSC